MLGLELVEVRLHRRIGLQGQGGTQGPHGRTPLFTLLEGAAQTEERLEALGLGLGAQIGIDRRGAGLGLALVAPVPGLGFGRGQGLRQSEPQGLVVRGQPHRRRVEPDRLFTIAGAAGGTGGRGQFGDTPILHLLGRFRRHQCGQAGGEVLGTVLRIGREEAEFGGAPIRQAGTGVLHHPTGDCPREGPQVLELVLEEAPARLGVVGEGAAGGGGETGRFADLQVDLFQDLQVTTEVVCILHQEQLPNRCRARALSGALGGALSGALGGNGSGQGPDGHQQREQQENQDLTVDTRAEPEAVHGGLL